MRTSRKIIFIVGLALILGAQAIFIIVLSTPDGVRIRSPEGSFVLDRSFIVSGDAWMKSGIQRIEVTASPRDGSSVSPSPFAAERDMVRSKGKALFPLSTWNARVQLPSDGAWELRAAVVGADGRRIETTGRMVQARAGTPVREFQSWSVEHLVPFAIIVWGAVALGFLARRPGAFDPIALIGVLVLWANEFTYQIYWFAVGGWATPTALMLQMCGTSILVLPFMLFSEKPHIRQYLFDILYFWGIGGALQALIAPDIGANGFPAFKYFSFFTSHGLIIALSVVMAMAGGLKITLRSMLRVFIVTNILLIPIYLIDRALALIPPYDPGNYYVLGYPPPTGSIVDLFSDIFGPAPRYLIGLELMGLAVFTLLWMPWPIARLIKDRKRASRVTDG
jgi:hypothetical integral membrane protein (TIGR02206 family)